MTFGEHIKGLRKKLRMTQRELADLLGVNFTYISKIENDKLEVLPSEELIRKMAGVLATDAEDLLDFAGKLDLKQLQQVAKEVPQAGVLLRRIQSGQLTERQWRDIRSVIDESDE